MLISILCSCRDKCKEDVLQKPIYNHELKETDVLSEEVCVLSFDMKTITVSELEDNSCEFTFVIQKGETFHGFCCWFQVDFKGFGDSSENDVILNTGPKHE